MKIVADQSKNITGRGSQKMLVRKDIIEAGRFRSLADMRGMKVAISAAGSASTVLDKFLEKAGLTANDITVVTMSFPQQVTALSNGAIDIALPAEPAVTEAVRVTGAKIVANDYDVYPYHQVAVLLYGGRFMKEKPETARGFMRAFLRGVRDHNDALKPDGWLRDDASGDAIAAIMAEYGPFKDPKVYRSFLISYCDPDGKLHMPSLEEDLAIFKTQKLIEGQVEVRDAVDLSFLDAALKVLGPYKPRG